MDHDHGVLRGHLNRLPGRDRLDDLHRVAMTVPDPDDAAMVHAMADLLQDLRQAHREAVGTLGGPDTGTLPDDGADACSGPLLRLWTAAAAEASRNMGRDRGLAPCRHPHRGDPG